MRILGALCGLFLALAAGAARADTIVLQQSGTTSHLLFVNELLPGPGTYVFSFASPGPLFMNFDSGYTYHWDVFRAPPPRPHAEFIEGNTSDVYGPFFDETVAQPTWTFVVPETTRTFFDSDEFYELAWGIPQGTPLYKEVRSEFPRFTFDVRSAVENNPAFTYDFTITRLSAAPEPATWAMMIVGFMAVGLSVRRRRAAA